jgi:hypothetical protein
MGLKYSMPNLSLQAEGLTEQPVVPVVRLRPVPVKPSPPESV